MNMDAENLIWRSRKLFYLLVVLVLAVLLLATALGLTALRSLALVQEELQHQRENVVMVKDENNISLAEERDSRPAETPSVTQDKSFGGKISIEQTSIASLVAEWRPRIAYITCDWKTEEGEVVLTKSGSGAAFRVGASFFIRTNKHVIADDDFLRAHECGVQFPDIRETFSTESIIAPTSGPDFGLIKLEIPARFAEDIEHFSSKESCPSASVGDSIIIIGYPTIGSETGITVTEGIISGLEGDYFITSAKVDEGNSGGAAILIKANCYLGIPTFVKRGGFESLARILSRGAVTHVLDTFAK